MNSVVIISSFFITYKLFKITHFVDSLISWFIFYLAQIVFTELLLGLLGILYLKNIILFNLAILLIIWLITKNRPSFFSSSSLKDSISELLKNKIILLGSSVILSYALVKIFINLINPPFGWDDLNYHFTFPVEWLKHGNLDIPITISDDPSPSYYPINGSLFFLWLMLPLRNVFLADLGQVPFFILAFLAIYSVSRKIGLSKEMSFYAATLLMLIANYFKQLQFAYIDVMVAALFLVCIIFLFLLNEKFSCQNVLIYSVSLGLLLGTKTVALPYCILLFIPFVYLVFKNLNKFYLFIFSLLAIVIFGGFTYIRNFIETGNPLYPLHFKLFGTTIFKGVMETSVYKAHFKIEDYSLSKLLFSEGLGVQTVVFILPAVFLALPVAWAKKKKSLNFNLAYFLILPLLIFIVYRYIIPLANTRYLYPLLGVGIIISFYTADILKIPKRAIKILVVICILVSMFELAGYVELATSIILTFLFFLTGNLLIRNIQKSRFMLRRPFVYVLITFIVVALILMGKNYIKNEYSEYLKMEKYSGFWPDATRAWEWLNKNTVGNNIAYVGRPVPFPLYGANFKNNVYYVSVNKKEPAKLHYFPNSYYSWDYDFLSLHKNLEADGNYRSNANYSIWLNNLFKKNTDYLFIYSLHQTQKLEFPLEDKWALMNPTKFISVFANDTIHIYKIAK